MLDLLATLLSGGLATFQITADPELESKLSQVFIAFDLSVFNDAASGHQVDLIIQHLQLSQTGEHVRYPGEQVLKIRKENMAAGIPLNEDIWREVQHLASLMNR